MQLSILACVLAVALPTLVAPQSSNDFNWSYNGCLGRDRWTTRFPACKGCRQSPININTNAAITVKNTAFVLSNFDSEIITTLNNDGKLVYIPITGKPVPSITMGGLYATYYLDRILFHWGSDSGYGSEHTIDNQRFAMEVQFLFYKTNYNNYAKAVKKLDGIAAFAVPVTAVRADNDVFNVITDELINIEFPNNTTPITLPNLSQFLPAKADFGKYFQYQGSIPTPGCFESCSWTVFRTPLNISENQLDAFRSLTDQDGEAMVNNYRIVQDIGLRKIHANYVQVGSPTGTTKKATTKKAITKKATTKKNG